MNQLYEALHVDEHRAQKEKEVLAQMEILRQELLPLEEVTIFSPISTFLGFEDWPLSTSYLKYLKY